MINSYYKNDDPAGAALSLGDVQQSEADITVQCKVLAKIIVQGIEMDPNPGLKWAISIMNQENLEIEIQSRLCQNFNYCLLPLLMEQIDIKTKFVLIKEISKINKQLVNLDPDSNTNLRSMAIIYFKEGELEFSFGDLQIAKQSFQNGLSIFEKLNLNDSESWTLLNYQARSFQRIAHLDIRFGDRENGYQNCKKAFSILENKKSYNHEEIVTVREIAESCYKLFKFYFKGSNFTEQVKYKQLLRQIADHSRDYGIDLDPKFQHLLKSF